MIVPNNVTNVDLPLMGLTGQLQHMISVNQFKDPKDPRNAGGPGGITGKYKVTFVLSRPGFNLLPERNYSFVSGLKGDSHLAIAKPAFTPPGNPDADMIRLDGLTEDGRFRFHGFPNDKGFLGKIESEPFDAQDFVDAERKAYRAIAPSLSDWSVHLDIPLHISQVESVEMGTDNTRTSILTHYHEVPLAIMPTADLKPEYRGYASLYREALNSNSPVYQFLCLFKMIEGMLRRRGRLAAEARKAGKRVTREHETIPANLQDAPKWLNAIFPGQRNWDGMSLSSICLPEVLGKSCKHVIDKELYPLRIDVAHAISSQSGELTLSVDELLHAEKVQKWLPITKCIGRRMLKNEFPQDFLPYLREDGTTVS